MGKFEDSKGKKDLPKQNAEASNTARRIPSAEEYLLGDAIAPDPVEAERNSGIKRVLTANNAPVDQANEIEQHNRDTDRDADAVKSSRQTRIGHENYYGNSKSNLYYSGTSVRFAEKQPEERNIEKVR